VQALPSVVQVVPFGSLFCWHTPDPLHVFGLSQSVSDALPARSARRQVRVLARRAVEEVRRAVVAVVAVHGEQAVVQRRRDVALVGVAARDVQRRLLAEGPGHQ